MDNRTISFLESGKTAYVSALREDGLGDLDIYRVKFPVNIIIQLQLPTKDPDNPIIKDAYVQLNNPLLKRSYTFKANKNTGFYTIILNRQGTYTLMIDAEGYEPYTEELDLKGSKDKDINFKFVKLLKKLIHYIKLLRLNLKDFQWVKLLRGLLSELKTLRLPSTTYLITTNRLETSTPAK